VEDTRGDTELRGPVSWSRFELLHYCRECAVSHARTSRLLMWIFGLFGVIVVGCSGIEIY
jgi:hypothetical protein